MASLTTGLIINTEVGGVRPSSTLSVKITNPDSVSSTIQISGFYWNGSSKIAYALNLLTLAPGEVANNDYFVQFDTFEFQFITSSDITEITAWGKDAAGNMTGVHRLLPVEFNLLGSEEIAGEIGPTPLNQIYMSNSSGNHVTVIDEKTNTLLENIEVGSRPLGVCVNPTTNYIYVANFGSNNVTVIDGTSNKVIDTITVGTNPVGVSVNIHTNRIYITNQGSQNVSVINGLTHGTIATITVGEFPGGIYVNSVMNRIYILNQGSNVVSVINGSTNTVIATVDVGS